MKEYITSILVVSIICFVARELLSSTNLSSHISFISGICIFLVAIMPLVSVIREIRTASLDAVIEENTDGTEYGSIFEDYIENAEIDLIKREIRSAVAQKFSLDESEIKVNIKYNSENEKRLERVSVTLLGRAVFANSNEIASYIEGKLGCEAVVIVGG